MKIPIGCLSPLFKNLYSYSAFRQFLEKGGAVMSAAAHTEKKISTWRHPLSEVIGEVRPAFSFPATGRTPEAILEAVSGWQLILRLMELS